MRLNGIFIDRAVNLFSTSVAQFMLRLPKYTLVHSYRYATKMQAHGYFGNRLVSHPDGGGIFELRSRRLLKKV